MLTFFTCPRTFWCGLQARSKNCQQICSSLFLRFSLSFHASSPCFVFCPWKFLTFPTSGYLYCWWKNLVCSSWSISARTTVLLWLMEISVKENAGSFRQLRHVANCMLKLSPKFIVSFQKVSIKTCGNVQKCCLELLFLNIQLQKHTTK